MTDPLSIIQELRHTYPASGGPCLELTAADEIERQAREIAALYRIHIAEKLELTREIERLESDNGFLRADLRRLMDAERPSQWSAAVNDRLLRERDKAYSDRQKAEEVWMADNTRLHAALERIAVDEHSFAGCAGCQDATKIAREALGPAQEMKANLRESIEQLRAIKCEHGNGPLTCPECHPEETPAHQCREWRVLCPTCHKEHPAMRAVATFDGMPSCNCDIGNHNKVAPNNCPVHRPIILAEQRAAALGPAQETSK